MFRQLLDLFDRLDWVELQNLVFKEFEVICKALDPVNVEDAFIHQLIALWNMQAILISVLHVFLLELAVLARVIVQVRWLTDQEFTHFVRSILLSTTQSSKRNICVHTNATQELDEIELLCNAWLCLCYHIFKPAIASAPKLCCKESLSLDTGQIGEVPAHLWLDVLILFFST